MPMSRVKLAPFSHRARTLRHFILVLDKHITLHGIASYTFHGIPSIGLKGDGKSTIMR